MPDLEITIAPGDLKSALDQLAQLTNLQLLYKESVIAGLRTRGVTRAKTPTAALDALIKGNCLTTTTDPSGAILIDLDTRKGNRRSPAKATSVPEASAPQIKLPATEPAEEVVVRGLLRYRPLEQGVARDDILAAGAGSVPDLVRTLPAVFGGGPNQDTHIGAEALANTGLGVGVNLRGLGARETLVLINGRRVAFSGSEGEFTDVMNIPLSSVASIDVLPDAAAARYGADAVGGVVNFKLRDDFSGAESLVSGGGGTRGELPEYTVAQIVGQHWDSGHAVVSLEVYHRGALPAADRSYATSDLAPFGGGNFDTNFSNPGNIVDSLTGQTWAIPSGQNGRHLSASQLVAGTENLHNRYLDAQIIPSQQRWSAYASVKQALNDDVILFGDALTSHRVASQTLSGVQLPLFIPNTNPFYINPAGGTAPVEVYYDFLRDIGPTTERVNVNTLTTTLGANFNLAQSWAGEVYASYSFETDRESETGLVNDSALALALADPNPLTAFNPFGDGSNTNPATVNAIGANGQFAVGSFLRVLDASAAGKLLHLPEGDLTLRVGAGLREEIFTTQQSGSSVSATSSRERSRNVASAFAETVIPLVSDDDGLPVLHSASMTVADRYENYGEAGSSITPKIELLGSPTANWVLRGTWSQSARPPTLGDLDDSHNQVLIVPVVVPTAPGSVIDTLLWSGGNAGAQSEHSVSWTGGTSLAPAELPGVSVDLTYFFTKVTGSLSQTYYEPGILTDPYYSAIVTHNPSAALIAQICAQAFFPQGTTSQCERSPVGAIVDLRVRNLGVRLTNGIDFRGSYHRETDLGVFDAALSGTQILTFAQAQTSQQPLISLLNTENNPLDLRLRLALRWTYAGFAAVVAGNFTNSYRDTASIPQRSVGSWTTVDLQLSYPITTPATHSHLPTTTVELDGQNVLDSSPPFLNNQVVAIGYDQENANPYGRILRLKIVAQW